MPRLLLCSQCKTLEEFPLFTGLPEDEAQDPLLDNLVRRHRQQHGEGTNQAALLRIEDKDWKDHREEILSQIKQRWTGFEPESYAVKATFTEDAGYCFGRHGRPKQGCIDWHDESKLLAPSWKSKDEADLDTSDRKQAEQIVAPLRKKIYLCDFCACSAYYTTRARMQKGMYDA